MLFVNGKKQTVNLRDLCSTPDKDGMIQDITNYGYEDSIWTLVNNRIHALLHPINIPFRYTFDKVKATDFLMKYAKTLNMPGHDAYITLAGGRPVIHKEEVGMRVDIDATVADLETMVQNGTLKPLALSMTNQNTVSISAKQLAGIDTIISQYSTTFNAGDSSRTHNIELAADKINGSLVDAGQTFSFNDIVGERTAEAGYDDAPVIVDGKLVPGIGGGICQVSSTLFNAALLSGMETVERTPHYEPVSYISAGRDATVSWGYLDYKFRNAYNHPIYVLSLISGNTITVYILGSSLDTPRHASITVSQPPIRPHKTVTKTDVSQKGTYVKEEGSDGMTVTTTRSIIYHDGSTYFETFDSLYDPTDTVIIKGIP